jgi:penicillin amidase
LEEWVSQLIEYAKAGFRPVEGKLESPGLEADVEVLTDRWGVPHVYAQSRSDLYFTQGYLHATERLFQVDLTRRLAQGRLSELFGELTLPLDRFYRTLGIGRASRSWLEKIDGDTRRIGSPYFLGFKAGAQSRPAPAEYLLLGSEPEFPENFEEAMVDTYSIALLMAFLLSANLDLELLRAWLAQALGPERARELVPLDGGLGAIALPAPVSEGMIANLAELLREAGSNPGGGSNNWAVSGAKSTTGKPLLANDPHLTIQMPGSWMEMHLSCPDLEVAGVGLPGIPGVVIGHNRRIAWGFTNTETDVQDLYLERLSDDASRYEYRGEWHPVEVLEEKIFVRGESEPRTHEVRLTRHGPLITSVIEGRIRPVVKEDAIREALALRWIHFDLVSSPRSIEAINTASGWEDFREAVRDWPGPGQNMIYADVDGTIGWQFTGAVPIRPTGSSGAAPLPGWTGTHEWQGTIPFDELPRAFNPEAGLVATANNRVVDLDYPYYLTGDWDLPYRIRRIVSLLNAKEKLSREDFISIQLDGYSGIADALLPILLSGVGGPDPPIPRSPAPPIPRSVEGAISPLPAEALKQLESWDRAMSVDSIAACIFAVWVTKIAEALFLPRLGEELFDAYFRRGGSLLRPYEAIRAILENPQRFWVGGDGRDIRAAGDALVGRALQEACDELGWRFGNKMSEWRWGTFHQVHFRHPLASAMPALDDLMSAGPYEAPGADDTINRASFNPGEGYFQHTVSSYRQIIDLSDFDKSVSVITTGNSGNPASPHYRDQSELWVRGEYHPMPFSRAAVEAASQGCLILTP